MSNILYCWEKNARVFSKAYFIRELLILLKKLLHKIHLILSFWSISFNHFFYYKRARIEMILCDLFFMMPVIHTCFVLNQWHVSIVLHSCNGYIFHFCLMLRMINIDILMLCPNSKVKKWVISKIRRLKFFVL